jgi:hypothetical protein
VTRTFTFPPRNRVKEVARGWMSNPGYKLASLVFAVIAWSYVQSGQPDEAKVRAALEWKLPPGLGTTEPLPQTVMVSVQGTRSATRRAERADVRLSADLSDADVGEHSLDFASLEVTGLPPTVSIVGFSPASVRTTLDQEAVRKAKANALIVGDPAPGYRVVSTTLEPHVVEIRGPRILVADLPDVRTKPIDVSNLSGDLDTQADLELPWGLHLATPGGLRAHIDIEPILEGRVMPGVTVVVRGQAVASHWTTDVETVEVTLQGPADTLRALTPEALVAWIDLDPNPTRTRYDAAFGPKEGRRLSIGGLPPDVRVIAVKPPIVEVTRK